MNSNEIILVKLGEIALKGLNRKTFESKLKKNMLNALKSYGNFNVSYAQSTFYISPKDENADMDKATDIIGKIFGISAYSRAYQTKKDMHSIKKAISKYLGDELSLCDTFKVEAKRSDKTFKLISPEICRDCGGYILKNYKNLSVDVHSPDIVVTVEIRDFGAYIRGNSFKGAGGIPVGSSGKAISLVSGGIDSPVATWMMAKRGLRIIPVHFASPPYTSEYALKKVVDLLTKIAPYTTPMDLNVINFTKIQETIQKNCSEELFTIIMRRLMMQIATRIAYKTEAKALVTGESLGQVASQTLDAINCTDCMCEIPVLRPLIGMDKDEIIRISRKIDTFDISIQPYEDCCTVFTPKHPKLKPIPKAVAYEQEKAEWKSLIDEAIDNVEYIKIGYRKNKIS